MMTNTGHEDKLINVHIISDSTGETGLSVARAGLAMFDRIETKEHMWTMVRQPAQLEKIIEKIKENPGIVLYTLVDHKLCTQIEHECAKLKVLCIPILARVIADLSKWLHQEVHGKPGKQHMLDKEYFLRMEAMNFTIAHDDGQMPQDLEKADIILVGASRTSKSPTSMYLAHRGYRVANVPYVSEATLPETLFTATEPVIIGLTINPERLVQVRKSRLLSLNEGHETSYVDVDEIKRELQETRRICARKEWPVIDVTRKSVEETAALILQWYAKRHASS